jgi:predicted metal-dependent RNase
MSRKFTEELITMHLETLSHGGKEAITLFMELSKQIHRHSAEDGLQDWVTIAATALPEKERNEVLVMLMCSHLYLDCQTQQQVNPEASAPTLH